MFRKSLFLTAIVAIFSFCCQTEAAQIDSTWVGDSEDNWGQSSNWAPAIVPDNNATNTFAVTINAGGGYVRIGLLQWRTIDQLDCYGEVELQNYTSNWVKLTLVDPNGLTNYDYLVIEGEGFEIAGNVTNTAGATLELEDMDIEGDLYNQAGATIEAFDEVCVDDGAVENAGSMTVTPAGKLKVEGGALHNIGQINIYGGECIVYDDILDNNDTGLINGFGVIYADQLLRNKGQIIAYGGSLAIASEGPLTNTGVLGNHPLSSLHIKLAVDVINNGTIEVNAGGGVAFDCNLINEPNNLLSEPNGVINLLGGNLAATTITQKAGAVFQGFGTITGGVVIEPNGLIELTGPTNIVGDVTIDPNATLEISDGTTLVTGDCACNNGTIHMIGGRIIIQGTFTNDNCNIIWEPGTYTNAADFNLDGTVNNKDLAAFAATWLWQAAWY